MSFFIDDLLSSPVVLKPALYKASAFEAPIPGILVNSSIISPLGLPFLVLGGALVVFAGTFFVLGGVFFASVVFGFLGFDGPFYQFLLLSLRWEVQVS